MLMNERDVQLIKDLAQTTQPQLHYLMRKTLHKKYPNLIWTDDYIIGVGNIPVAIVAHMDTVFATPPEAIYYDQKQNIMWSPDGLGADDRAGVFAILKIIQSGLRPTVILTTDEEVGALGARSLVDDIIDAPEGLKYIIQLDRRGMNDCVFYDCDNPEFVKYVESFGFKENFGSFSDISIICPEWKVAGVNVSVGYNDEHSNIETLNTSYLMLTISRVKKMLEDGFNAQKFEYIPIDYKKYSSYPMNPYAFAYGGWTDDEDYGYSGSCECAICKKQCLSYETINAVYPGDEKEYYYCLDCCDNKVDWCRGCGNPYPSDENKTYCPACRKKKKK